MNADLEQSLLMKLKALSPFARAETEPFIDFVGARDERTRDASGRRLAEAFAKLDDMDGEPMSAEEIQAEIEADRAERRARRNYGNCLLTTRSRRASRRTLRSLAGSIVTIGPDRLSTSADPSLHCSQRCPASVPAWTGVGCA